MRELLDAVVDEGSFLEVHKRWAKELIVGYARLEGRVVGIVANQPKFKGGVLFVDSADKAARFIWTCDAFGIPLLFLADVPGFMIGTAVEKQGIIRHGAKMIAAVSEATVPKLSVIVRKAYGAGLYAMAGPAFDPDATLALPTAKIAVMGPSAAVNAVFYNQLQAIEDEDERAAKRVELMEEYAEGVDLLHLASELVIDGVVQPEDLRAELVRRFARYAGKHREWPAKRHGISPVVAREQRRQSMKTRSCVDATVASRLMVGETERDDREPWAAATSVEHAIRGAFGTTTSAASRSRRRLPTPRVRRARGLEGRTTRPDRRRGAAGARSAVEDRPPQARVVRRGRSTTTRSTSTPEAQAAVKDGSSASATPTSPTSRTAATSIPSTCARRAARCSSSPPTRSRASSSTRPRRSSGAHVHPAALGGPALRDPQLEPIDTLEKVVG